MDEAEAIRALSESSWKESTEERIKELEEKVERLESVLERMHTGLAQASGNNDYMIPELD